MAFRGGARCDAPLWPNHKIFYRRLHMKKCIFLPFSRKNCKIQQCLMVFCVSKFQKNGRNCSFRWTFRSKKCFSFRGASPHWPPDQGLCAWTPLGAPPPDPVIGSRSTRSQCPPPLCRILNTPLHNVIEWNNRRIQGSDTYTVSQKHPRHFRL